MLEKNQKKNKNMNIRIFPFYKMLSWDLLFYYSIIFLYLINVKGLTASEVLLGETSYMLATMLFQIPASKIVDLLGKKHSVIIANIFLSVSTFLLLIITSFNQLVLVYVMQGFAYAIKGISEDIILYNSLPKTKNRGMLFSKINGRASSYYYYIDAFSALVTGYLYTINPYFPIIICLVCNILSTILSFKFEHTDDRKTNSNETENIEEVYKTTENNVRFKDVLKHVYRSKRLLSLTICYALISGLLYVLTTLRSSIFEELKLGAQYFGMIYAVLQIIAGLSARLQNIIHNKFKNKTLSVLGMPLVISCILIGFIGNIINDVNNLGFVIVLGIFVIQGVLKGAYRSLIVRYLNNFTNSKIRTKLTTIQNMIYNMVAISFSFISSLVLKITTTSNTFIFVGCLSTIGLVLILDYMRGKVGKSPEEYSKEDLKYSSIKLNENNNSALL